MTDGVGVGSDLVTADLDVVGRIGIASNAVFLVEFAGPDDSPDDGDEPRHAIYKPIRGERPLWDFPHGQLAFREVAAYLISRAGGWDLVPPTVLRDGPYGPGSVQLWIEELDAGYGDQAAKVDRQAPAQDVVIAPVGRIPAGYLGVLQGRLDTGAVVEIAHADIPDLASMATLDAVLNNSDRKASHLLRDNTGRLWGVDHGVSLHEEDKLRTVLWGWQGRPLPVADLGRLSMLRAALIGGSALPDRLAALLTGDEIDALRDRVDRLLSAGTFPKPPNHWPSVPWPPL